MLHYEENLLFFFSVSNSPCNNVTEDCAEDPNNGSAICTCKLGYEINNITQNCTGMIRQRMRFIVNNLTHLYMQISTNVWDNQTHVMHKVRLVWIPLEVIIVFVNLVMKYGKYSCFKNLDN